MRKKLLVALSILTLVVVLGVGVPTITRAITKSPQICVVTNTASQTSSDTSAFAESVASYNTCNYANSGTSYWEFSKGGNYLYTGTIHVCSTYYQFTNAQDIWYGDDNCVTQAQANTPFGQLNHHAYAAGSGYIVVDTAAWSGFCNSISQGSPCTASATASYPP